MQQISTAADAMRQRSLHFLVHHDLWLKWPFLPLVRRKPGCEEERGLVFDAFHVLDLPGYSSTVFFTNRFMLPPTLDEFLELPREVFDNPEDLIGAGWRVA